MPWTRDGANFGFTPPDSTASTWLPQPAWFAEYSFDVQRADPKSTLNTYRRLLAERGRLFDGVLEWVDAGHPDVLAFVRGAGLCVVNFASSDVALPSSWMLQAPVVTTSTSAAAGSTVAADSASWFALTEPERMRLHSGSR
jgi:alpha-glucosidase